MFESELALMAALRKLYKTLDDSLSRNLKELGVSTTDYLIMSILNGTGPIPMQKLREYVLISSGSITYATNRIIGKGYVMKVQDHDDKRMYHVQLTSKGEIFYAQINEQHLPYISQLLSSFSNEELKKITKEITNLSNSVEDNK